MNHKLISCSWTIALAAAVVFKAHGADIPVRSLPALDVAGNLELDKKAHHPGRQRFAEARDVHIDPETHGQWSDVAGGRLWRMRVQIPAATDINLGFERFQMPIGGTLTIRSLSGNRNAVIVQGQGYGTDSEGIMFAVVRFSFN